MAMLARRTLTTTETAELTDAFRRWILQLLSDADLRLPVQTWLFGSAARGELTDVSDMDIALICEDDAHVQAVRHVLGRARRPLDWPVDLVYFTRAEFERKRTHGGVAWLIAREGVRLIDGGSEAAGDVR